MTTESGQTVGLNPKARAEEITTLRITGMDCADEVAAIERVLKPLEGLREVKVNLISGTVTIAHQKEVTAEH